MIFLGQVGHGTWNNLEPFRNVTVNPLNPRSIFLFSGSLFVSIIMEKRVNVFSRNFHDMTGTMQEVII